MKRTLALVLLAAVAVWAGLMYEPARAPKAKPRSAQNAQDPTQEAQGSVARSAEQEQAASSAVGSSAKAAAARSASSTAKSPAPAPPKLRFQGQLNTSSARGDIASQNAHAARGEAVERPQVDPSGELGEGILSPDFVELETDYVNEHREGPWALAHEQRIRQAIYDAGLAERMVLVHCQSSVCRLHFEASGPDSYAQLLRTPALVQATGLTPDTPYSMNTTELIVYARPPAIPEPDKP
jgi:hypothetical protein